MYKIQEKIMLFCKMQLCKQMKTKIKFIHVKTGLHTFFLSQIHVVFKKWVTLRDWCLTMPVHVFHL